MSHQGHIGLSGSRTFAIKSDEVSAPLRWKIDNFVKHYFSGWWKAELSKLVAKITGNPVLIGTVKIRVRNNLTGIWTNYGEVSRRIVTDAGVAAVIDAFLNTFEVETFNFHGFGTGGAAEAVGNTALTTELTTQYATDNVRPTGTQSNPTAPVYRTVGTLDPDADVGITEHGIFSQAATGGGQLLDRSLFSIINITGAGTNTLEVTYELTMASGG